ncbi:MAG: permease-like cell division protein FtsX [Kangiellaceae bacterium]
MNEYNSKQTLSSSATNQKSPSKNSQGANYTQNASISNRLKMLLRLHKIEAKRGLNEIAANPFTNFMTVLVIAIALALPAGLQILLENGKVLSQSWDGASRISLYLQLDLSEQEIKQTLDKVNTIKSVESVKLVNSDQALEEFSQYSGFGDIMDELDSNPLPTTFIVQPKSHSPSETELLLQELKAVEFVEVVQLDLDWVRKLHAILLLAEKLAAALGLALGISVLLIVGNTIRLSVQNRKEEIEVVKLVGATNAFIRRPFLYTGFWYGLFAGILCWILLGSTLYWLAEPIANLSGLYESEFILKGLSFIQSIQLISIGCLLGLLGSWLSVGRHIRQIEPH